jgi:hypothetical protein
MFTFFIHWIDLCVNLVPESINLVLRMNKDQIIIGLDKRDITCPITNQIMRCPVIAPDGHTYEKSAIIHWVETKSVSPFTRKPIEPKFFPNILVQNLIENAETINRDIYMERYQYDFKSFLTHYISKYIPEIEQTDKKLYDELLNFKEIFDPNSYIYPKHKYTKECKKCKGIKCHHLILLKKIINFNKIHEVINVCAMPDRKILYRALFENPESNELLEQCIINILNLTSLHDEGMGYLIQSITILQPSLFNCIDPAKYYQIISYQGFKEYIKSIRSIEEFNQFMSHRFKYFDPKFRKYLLHCVLSNSNLLFDSWHKTKTVQFITNLSDESKISEIYSFSNDLDNKSDTTTNVDVIFEKSLISCLLENYKPPYHKFLLCRMEEKYKYSLKNFHSEEIKSAVNLLLPGIGLNEPMHQMLKVLGDLFYGSSLNERKDEYERIRSILTDCKLPEDLDRNIMTYKIFCELKNLKIGQLGTDEIIAFIDNHSNNVHDHSMLCLLLDTNDMKQISEIDKIVAYFFEKIKEKNSFQKFIEWMIQNNISIHKKYYDSYGNATTIHSIYIRSVYQRCMDYSGFVSSRVIDNINVLFDNNVSLDNDEDLYNLQQIILRIWKDTSLDKLILHLKARYAFNDGIWFSILRSGCSLNHEDFYYIIDNMKIVSQIDQDEEKSENCLDALLLHHQLDIQIFDHLIKKYPLTKESDLCLLLKNKNVNLQMLQKLPVQFTQRIIDCAINNESLDGSIYRYLMKNKRKLGIFD